jgi:hypothetical protein
MFSLNYPVSDFLGSRGNKVTEAAALNLSGMPNNRESFWSNPRFYSLRFSWL